MATGKYPSAANLRWTLWSGAETGTRAVTRGVDHVCRRFCDWLEYKGDKAWAEAARKYDDDDEFYEGFMRTPKERREEARLRLEAMKRSEVCILCKGTGRNTLAALEGLEGD
jgi:hypothetical protein